MPEYRCDVAPIRAALTEDGYLVDPAAIITRTGIFEYRRADGSLRREYRPPEEVFAARHLSSWRGKPVTIGHPGQVSAQNVRRHAVGTVISDARQDGDNVVAEVIVHEPSAITSHGQRELSCGYAVEIDATPGTVNGQRYDCIQRNLRANHLAIVPRGRAGNARLNLDAADIETDEETECMADDKPRRQMSRVRLDSGIEYDAEAEVARELTKLRDDLTAASKRADTAEAERDTLKAKADKHADEIKAAREDAAKEAGAAAVARATLELAARQHGVEVKADHTPRQIREAIVKKVRGDGVDFTEKSDAYVEATYDMAIADAGKGGAPRGDGKAAPASTTYPGGAAGGTARADSQRPASVSASTARNRMVSSIHRAPNAR